MSAYRLFEMQLLPKLGEVVFKMSLQEEAIAKGRPRVARGGHVYTPERTRKFEQLIESNARLVAYNDPADYPVKLQMHIVALPPASWPEWKRQAALDNRIYPSRGDVDNKIKAITDALNGVAYIDDKLIVTHDVQSYYGLNNLITLTLYRVGWSQYDLEQYAEWRKTNVVNRSRGA